MFLLGDNIELLTDLDIVDFVYMDPPYMTGRDFGDFLDKFNGMDDFVRFISSRVKIIHSKLSDRGTLVVHVDSISSHYLKVELDNIFGRSNFQNEIILTTNNNKKVKKRLMRSHDVLLVYSKKNSKHHYTQQYTDYAEDKKWKYDDRGAYTTSAAKNSQPNVVNRPNLKYEWNGNTYQWWVSKEKMQELHDDDRLVYNKEGVPRIKRYKEEIGGIPMKDVWTDISSVQIGEKMDYATQKPVKLLDRLLSLYTSDGFLCLDPFAGSGSLGRACINRGLDYILMDINPKAKDIFNQSIKSNLL